jgi:hypothetical protein
MLACIAFGRIPEKSTISFTFIKRNRMSSCLTGPNNFGQFYDQSIVKDVVFSGIRPKAIQANITGNCSAC